jgi:uncharacterized protein DUF3800
MHLIYIDETGDGKSIGYSAVAIPAPNYNDAFALIKKFRHNLKASDGIFTTVELHASKFTSGRGRIAKEIISQERRCQIFFSVLDLVTNLPGVAVFNAFRPVYEKLGLLERLLNRIERTVNAWGSQAILLFDEGEEKANTALLRKMRVYNPIRSMYGTWPDGNEYRNIPLVRIIEDPVFRQSHRSYFIQLADFCAYALFQKERPTESRARFGLHYAFHSLSNVLVFDAYRADKYGIVR